MASVSLESAPGHRCPTLALCSLAGTEISQAVRQIKLPLDVLFVLPIEALFEPAFPHRNAVLLLCQ